MALYYRSSTSHTAHYGGSNNSDPSIHLIEWLSYQVTDWINRIGPAYGAIKYNHEDWDAHGDYTVSDYIYLQIALRGADYRAANDSGYDHGFEFRTDYVSTSNAYFLFNRTNFTDGRYSSGSGGGPGRWGESNSRSLISSRYLMRESYFETPRLAQVMYSDTPGKRFFAFDIFGQRAVIHEAVDLAHTGKNYDPGWITSVATQIERLDRMSSSTSDPNYYTSSYTSFYPTNSVGTSQTENFRGIKEKIAIRDYFGRYYGTTSNVWYPQFTLPLGWTWTYEDQTFVSWDSRQLIEITGLTDG